MRTQSCVTLCHARSSPQQSVTLCHASLFLPQSTRELGHPARFGSLSCHFQLFLSTQYCIFQSATPAFPMLFFALYPMVVSEKKKKEGKGRKRS
jgi:hypothetical protein